MNDQLSTRRTVAPSLLLLAGLTAGLATTFGSNGSDLRPVAAQVAAALLTAALTLAVVPLALRARDRAPQVPEISSAADFLTLNLALLSAGAASVHFGVISGHFAEWWGFGTFFVVAAVAQLAWALLAVKRPSRLLFTIGALGNSFLIVTWVLSRTSGLPFGPDPWTPERIGLADAVSSGLEAVIVAGAIALALRGGLLSARGARRGAKTTWLIACATLVVVALSLLSAVGAASGVIPSSG